MAAATGRKAWVSFSRRFSIAILDARCLLFVQGVFPPIHKVFAGTGDHGVPVYDLHGRDISVNGCGVFPVSLVVFSRQSRSQDNRMSIRKLLDLNLFDYYRLGLSASTGRAIGHYLTHGHWNFSSPYIVSLLTMKLSFSLFRSVLKYGFCVVDGKLDAQNNGIEIHFRQVCADLQWMSEYFTCRHSANAD